MSRFTVQPVWRNSLAMGVLILAIWLPRAFSLDRLVTPDEPTWLTMSANFYQAITHADFSHTYQIEHPGVTTMWIGMMAFLWRYPTYIYETPKQFEWWLEEVGPFLAAQGHPPLDVLAAGRFIMALCVTIVLVAAFGAAARLFGFWTSWAGFLLIATDPFHIALSRLLHLDGLLSSLILLSFLSLMNYLYRGKRRVDLFVSGVSFGLACLTKSPALFLIPFVGLLFLIELFTRWQSQQRLGRQDWQWAVNAMVAWSVTGFVVFVLLWPAMWVDPLYTVRRILAAMVTYAATGHQEAPLYFNGAIIQGDPGIDFYPITYLWRITPVVLAGLGLTTLAFTRVKGLSIPPIHQRPAVVLVLFAILFTLFMSLGAKKFDRYLLPIYPALTLVAAVGWVATIRWLLSFRLGQMRPVVPIILVVIFTSSLVSVIESYPYYLSYYNPLLGGTPRAPTVMMVGWGEGLDQAARYLNSLPNAEHLKVVTSVWGGTFSYFFKGQVYWSTFDPTTSHVEEWTSSDYYVAYINHWQRGRLPSELLDYLAETTPVMVVRLQGLEYVLVYDLHQIPPPPYLLANTSSDP